MVRGYPGALFVSAGGYHHHIGLNTWGTAGAPPPPEGARGLARLEVVVPGAAEVDRIEGRARAAGAEAEREGEGLRLRDPSGNRVLVRD
jgi:catechol 2,3-dioxygenase